MKKRMRSTFANLVLGFFLMISLSACGPQKPLPAASEVDSVPTSPPPVLSRKDPASLPEICNCVLRFDHISIEQGLSQSSVHTIFQDSRGFLWFGTEDGLNRYDGYTFTNYKPEPDVPNTISDRWITAIVEDSDGYMWIGTRQGGLNRFNYRTGTFINYVHNSNISSSLSNNHVNTLFIDQDNNLWVGTSDGLDLLNPSKTSFTHFSYNPNQPNTISGRSITFIYQDHKKQLWVGTAYSGLNYFDPKTGKFNTYIHNPNNPVSISNNRITAIEEDADQVLWIGTQNGLNRFDPKMGTFTTVFNDPSNPNSLINDDITALYSDHSGNLWVGTADGLDRVSSKYGPRFTHYHNEPSYLKSLSNNYILSIYEDQGGVLWFGTYNGGVNKYDRERDKFAYFRNEPENPNSLSGNFIFSILPDENDNIWIGTYGNGLNRFNRTSTDVIRFEHIPEDPYGLSSNIILALAKDQEGLLWIGTGGDGLNSYNSRNGEFVRYQNNAAEPNSLGGNFVYAVFEDSLNNLWIGTNTGLDRFDRESGDFIHYIPAPGDPRTLGGNNVSVIVEDHDGNLWVGTFENGLYRLDKDTGEFTRYKFDPDDNQSLSNDSVLSIYPDNQGQIWVGTAGGGLNQYHPDTGTFSYYLEKDGLPNGVVYGILEDDNGYLWLSTNFGISRFDPENVSFRNYDAGDGLQSNEFNMGAFAKSDKGEFYFGGINGLTVFDPLEITNNPRVPQITLTSLTQDGQPIETQTTTETIQNISLKWPQDSFEFDFAALSYNQPSKNQYAYMLQGLENRWNYIGTKHNGRYTNLSGGTYTLLLKATNSDGVWNEAPVRINISVIPPFWETTLFRILLVFVVLALTAGGIGLRTKSIQDRNRQLEQLVRERTGALETRNQEIQALYQADERILRNVSLKQVFQTLVDVAVDTLDADRSVVFAWDEEQTKVVPRISRGFSPETLKVLEFKKGEGIIGKVLETGKPAIVRRIELDDFREDIRDALIAEGIRSFIHLPIIVDHKIAGVFNVGFTRPNLMGDDITRLFSALTKRASISIANMELFEQTKDLAVMEERNRLARDLHDSAKQKAFAALAQLGTVRGILNGNGNSATIHLTEAENLVSDVIQELTFLVQEIYPTALQEKGLPTILREYAFEWENRNDIKVNLALQNERRLPLGVEQAIYRVTQETLANAARHSQAKRMDISLMYNSDSLQLSLADDGRGFDMDLKGHGLGLRSIRERVSSIHGTVQIQSAPGQGTRIIVQVPTKSKEGGENGKE